MDQTRVVIVTGAAKGIGFAIATRFAREGCRVALLDIDGEKAADSARQLADGGGQAMGVACDVSSPDSIQRAVDLVAEAYGGIDVVVNNAGILYSSSIPDLTEQEWDRVMAVNLKGTFFTVQKALPHLKKSAAPRVVNISSLAGRMGGYNTSLSYSASKGGILALTMGFARQLAPFQITVNAVCPSTTESDMILLWDEETRALQSKRAPLGRLGKPEEVASAVYYLASEEAGFITGLLMDVNGGTYMG